jgi:hypothetical protein
MNIIQKPTISLFNASAQPDLGLWMKFSKNYLNVLFDPILKLISSSNGFTMKIMELHTSSKLEYNLNGKLKNKIMKMNTMITKRFLIIIKRKLNQIDLSILI